MRLIFVSRVMSGFAASLRDGIWAPTGAPAIHRLMSKIVTGVPDTRFILLCREAGFDFQAPWTTSRDIELRLAGFPAPMRVLAGAHALPKVFGRLRGHLAELRQLLILLAEIRRFRPDAVYFERGTALLAGIVARLMPGRVVLRLLGILPWMNELAASRSIYHCLLRWAYRAPFGLVICSEDGSGGESWMAENLARDVPRVVMLNGVDSQPADPDQPALRSIPDGRVVVLMLGRLEKLRRCEDFIEAVLALPDDCRARIHALVVGDGPLRAQLVERVNRAGGQETFTFAGALPPQGVAAALRRSDIYVMLNDMCCLTNTTLEALRAGLCPVVLEPPGHLADDRATKRLLPADIAIRIPRGPADEVRSTLVRTLVRLVAAPEELSRRRARVAAIATTELGDWDARLSRELEMIERVADGRSPTEAAVG